MADDRNSDELTLNTLDEILVNVVAPQLPQPVRAEPRNADEELDSAAPSEPAEDRSEAVKDPDRKLLWQSVCSLAAALSGRGRVQPSVDEEASEQDPEESDARRSIRRRLRRYRELLRVPIASRIEALKSSDFKEECKARAIRLNSGDPTRELIDQICEEYTGRIEDFPGSRIQLISSPSPKHAALEWQRLNASNGDELKDQCHDAGIKPAARVGERRQQLFDHNADSLPMSWIYSPSGFSLLDQETEVDREPTTGNRLLRITAREVGSHTQNVLVSRETRQRLTNVGELASFIEDVTREPGWLGVDQTASYCVDVYRFVESLFADDGDSRRK